MRGLAKLKPLPRSFYDADAVTVAQAMIGKVLVHASPEGLAGGRIVETEAYCGPEDQAAHSHNWRRTARTEVMWGPPARAYMFLIYGMHWCFNAVVAEDGTPHAVLVRALEPLGGQPLMARRRGMAETKRELTNGPGKLCAALGLDGAHKGLDLSRGPLFLADDPAARLGPVKSSPRINIDYAGDWVRNPWRWYEAGNRYVSVKPKD